MQSSPRLVATLLFGSGFAALVYQTAWQRMFRLVFGASTGASAAVLGIFLGGLGLGGYWLGKRAERSERPLLFYGNLEVGISLAAAITPALLWASAKLYLAVGGSPTLGVGGATVLRLLIAAIVMGPAAVLMGGTLPAAARAVETSTDAARSRLATLYALNTCGAVAGAFLGTFFFFEALGTHLALWSACLINLVVAITARSLGREAAPVPRAAADDDNDGNTPSAHPRLVYVAAGAVGFVFLWLELVWYRMLAPILGGSTFTFGLVLSVALAGIGIGGLIYAGRDASRPASLSLLAATLALEALAVGIPLALGDDVALVAAYVRPMASMGFPALVVAWTLIASIVVLPAAIVAGYQFPVLFALLGRGRHRVAAHVGVAYAFNTTGSILGAVLGGFVLIPWLGAVDSWRCAVLLLVALAAVAGGLAIRRELRTERSKLVWSLVVLVPALAAAFTVGPTAVWRHAPIGAGRTDLGKYDRNELEAWMQETRAGILWERDGVESAIALDNTSGVAFVVNGKVDGHTLIDRGTQTMAGLLPVMIHPSPHRVFVVGLGTGMTAGWAASAPHVEHVDVAELEPSILEIARASALANQNVVEREDVNIFLGDGREFLMTTDARYDVIVSEPSNPYRAGVSSLFTRDFYEVVDARLADGGVLAQWVQGYEIDVHTLRIIVNTLRSVFPVVEAWQTDAADFLLVASRQPRTIDVAELRTRAKNEPYRTALARMWFVDGAEGVLSHFVANASHLDELAEDAGELINTDDDNILEFAFARSVGQHGSDLVLELLLRAAATGGDRPRVHGDVSWPLVEELRPRSWNLSGGAAPALPMEGQEALMRAEAVSAGCLGEHHRVLELAPREGETNPNEADEDILAAFSYAMAYAFTGDRRVEPLAEGLRRRGHHAEADLAMGRYFAARGRESAALDRLIRAVEHMREVALPICTVPRQVLRAIEQVAAQRTASTERAARALLVGPLAAYSEERLRIRVAQRLAFASGDPALCVQAMGRELTAPWWERRFLASRAACLAGARHPLADKAEADLSRFLAHGSGFIRPVQPSPRSGRPPAGSPGSSAADASRHENDSDAGSADASRSDTPSERSDAAVDKNGD